MAKVVTEAVQNIREVERHSGDLGRAKRFVDVIQYKLKHWKYIVEPSIHQGPDHRNQFLLLVCRLHSTLAVRSQL